ncbi:DNA polymerase III subunit gamma/ tau protein [Dioscorea alata]|uniref:DNA polymerase III subunit gamma/ tau protein n=1 Tax=Dioscorea alata TaxID=55571 RepID=A0ACB7W192_DIOAL|nr:DNA polymerase III subunit gamma/ tau protein [Dioscorea alata]
MVEPCVGPSELHLKKELSALRKARFLRDPETCSSWRSPLSSRSLAASYVFTHGNGTRGSATGASNSSGLIGAPSRNNNKKKVYLYNWRHHSAKSSDSGTKLDEDNRGKLLEDSPEDSVSNTLKLDSQSDTSLQAPANICSVSRGSHLETSVRRALRKSHRSSTIRKRTIKHSPITKHLDLPSDSLGIPNPVEQSDDTEYCNSEDLKQSKHVCTHRTGYVSHSASPLFSGSGRKNWSRSKIFRSSTREESSHSYTPASTSSYNRYGVRNPSTVGSWDGTTSFDEDELDHMELARRQGCGIPCYWPKRPKDVGCGGWYSPSLSDTLKRTGSSVLCGGQKLYNKRRLASSRKQKYMLKSSHGLPLLTNGSGRGRGSSSSDVGSDELSTNLVELDLEALSRLDGKRWSSCKSQDGWELALPGGPDLEMHDHRGLSHKYRPRSFDEIMGQNIVVQSLSNAIGRARIAPSYIFHGPRGTGKTSTARIFSAALNCMSTEDKKPCGFCKECNDFSSGRSNVIELDATNRKSMDSVRYMLKNLSATTKFSRYKVFIIDECHMLSSKLWSLFMKFLEAPPPRVVFIYITNDPDNLPRSILSRCQKYLFPKIKDADIICRLQKLSAEENLEVEVDALNLIASNSDGSLRDAETMLDQLSLLGKKITTALVNDLVGVVSEEKLLDLLEIAMSSDTAETVKRSRELMDSGVDPMALMSQLAALIMDIIAGTYQLANCQNRASVLSGRSLTEAELEKLQQALKILSDAEKQLRLSSERSTWFTAALLQLGSGHAPETAQSSNSSKHSVKLIGKDPFDPVKEILLEESSSHPQSVSREQVPCFGS